MRCYLYTWSHRVIFIDSASLNPIALFRPKHPPYIATLNPKPLNPKPPIEPLDNTPMNSCEAPCFKLFKP